MITTDTTDLVKKADHNAKINETKKEITDDDHDKYITTESFNKSASDNVTARLAKANLTIKNDIANLVKKDRLWW